MKDQKQFCTSIIAPVWMEWYKIPLRQKRTSVLHDVTVIVRWGEFGAKVA